MLTKVTATRESFHCIEEVVMVEEEEYHIYYLLFCICYLPGASVVPRRCSLPS